MSNKFLIVTPFTIPEQSGSGIHAFRFGQYLNNIGYSTEILSFNRNLFYKTIAIKEGLKIFRIPYFNRFMILKIISLPLVYLGILIKVISSQIVIIYGNQIAGLGFLLLVSRLCRKKIVYRSTLLGVDDFRTLIAERRNLFKPYITGLLQESDVYFSINKEFTSRYNSMKGKKALIFESVQGTDTNLFQPVDKETKAAIRIKLGLPSDKFIIISTGFLLKRKGFDELFQALATLKDDFLLLVAGQCEAEHGHFLEKKKLEMQELKVLGEQLLGEKIKFIGFSFSVQEHLQASDIFILNSKVEGTPNALLEAMATGMPIMIREIAGLQNFLCFNGQNCLEFSDKELIAEYILKLKNNPELRNKLGVEARKMAEENFSFDKVSTNLIGKINSL